MSANKTVGRLNLDLRNMQAATARQHRAEHGYNLDVAAEKKAVAAIDQQKQALLDAFTSPTPLDAAAQSKLLDQLFALGESEVRAEDAGAAKLAGDKALISAEALSARKWRSKALKDLTPAEYLMNLKQTNAYRKALGLKPVKGVIRPKAPPVKGRPTAADVAERFLGWSEYRLKPSGKLDMDQWTSFDSSCANFVSGCLEAAGQLTHAQRNDTVGPLANILRGKGWRDVDISRARRGDVVCFDGPDGPYQHVEIFDHWQGKTPVFIGSNNTLPDGTQAIGYDVGGRWAYRFHVLQAP